MEEEYFAPLGLLLFCGYLAYLLMRWLWPIYEQREGLTFLQMVKEAWAAPKKERERQAVIFGSWKKTQFINLVNFGLLLAWAYFGTRSHIILWGVFSYQVIGFIVLRVVSLPAESDLPGLNLNKRLWLRVFYAWLWPVYFTYLWRRK